MGHMGHIAFIHGCMPLEGNTREDCENVTDS